LLVFFSMSGRANGEGFCDPLLCSCTDTGANCTLRGFLAYPAGLPPTTTTLDLSSNDLTTINATEIQLYPNLQTLILRNNKIEKFTSGPNNVLLHLDLSNNRISSLSRNVDLSLLEAVETLDLSNNILTTINPASFPSGKRLEILNLSSNQIELLESNCFDDLTRLLELRLNRNKLSSFPKTVFKRMSSLRVLELNKNKLVEIPGLTFHGLGNVKSLKLRKNNIKFLMDGAFFGLNSMEQLYLDRNQVRTVSKGWLYGVNKLKQLSLAYNKVDYIEEDGWEFCRELWQLDLRGNALKIVEREILRKLPSLTHLDLGENLISHIDADKTFGEVPKLEVLKLDMNQLSHTIEDTPSTFKALKDLRELGLSGNAIKSVGKNALTGLRSLQQLDLADNVISTIQENPFEHSPLLTDLVLNTSSLLCDCNIRWLPEWINQTGVEGVRGTCAHPEHLKGRLLTSISSDQFTCEDTPKPFLLVEPATQIGLRGKDITLSCSAASTSSEEMSFTWKQDSDVLKLSPCTENQDESCILSMSHKSDGKGMEMTSELRLKNLTHHNIGAYQCIVENRFGATYSGKADITVYVFPRFLTTPSDITARGGDKAVLKCSATGVPAPSISWQKDNGGDFPAAKERRIRVDTETNTYIINNIKPADMGLYTCTASNLAGAITTNITLSVLDRPKFVKSMEDKEVNLGETAVLECIASGSPKPYLTWKKNKGPLYPTERHFFTADNQLLIIVKVGLEDAGGYECEMRNQLGAVTQTSFLTVNGGDVVASSDPTTGIIVVAVVCCILGTSLVWVFIIYHTRRRGNQQDWEIDKRTVVGGMTTLGESGLPLLAQESIPARKPIPLPVDDSASERDSGTGDSKRSFDNINNADHVVDTVIHNFLSARGEEGWGGWASPPPLSEHDTGISSISGGGRNQDGSVGGRHRDGSVGGRHRDGCPNGSATSFHLAKPVATPLPPGVHPARSSGPPSEASSRGRRTTNHKTQKKPVEPVVATISLAVENPLYDSLPVQNNVNSLCDNKDKLMTASANFVALRSPSPSASLISDSIAYCGRWPAADRRMCPQCGELLAECPHRDLVEDDIESVSSAGRSSTGQSSAPSTTVSDQPLSFNTFHPRRHNDRTGSTDHLADRMACDVTARDLLSPAALTNKCKKRLSAIELPSGETYLPIEAALAGRPGDRDAALEAKEYRGGGTLPRHGLQQEWLEASLNASESGVRPTDGRSTLQRNKERGSKISLFRHSRREKRDAKREAKSVEGHTNSLGRRKSGRRKSEGKGGPDVVDVVQQEHTDVAFKSAEMFS